MKKFESKRNLGTLFEAIFAAGRDVSKKKKNMDLSAQLDFDFDINLTKIEIETTWMATKMCCYDFRKQYREILRCKNRNYFCSSRDGVIGAQQDSAHPNHLEINQQNKFWANTWRNTEK